MPSSRQARTRGGGGVPPLAWGSGADGVGFVGETNVERSAVGVAVNGNRGDAQLAAGAQEADGDFPAIGDEDFAEHVTVLGRGAEGILKRRRAGRLRPATT